MARRDGAVVSHVSVTALRKEMCNGGPGTGEKGQRRQRRFKVLSREHVFVERVVLKEREERVAAGDGRRRAL